MISRRESLAAAELAAFTGNVLNEVDSKMITPSSTSGSANKLNPRDFLPSNKSQQGRRQVQNTTTNNKIIPKDVIVEPPKSRPAGSEVVGTETVKISDLMIPVDGMDKKMKEAIAKYSQPQQVQKPQQQAQKPQQQAQKPQQTSTITISERNEILNRLSEINDKLDFILKRAKIQPRYKNKG